MDCVWCVASLIVVWSEKMQKKINYSSFSCCCGQTETVSPVVVAPRLTEWTDGRRRLDLPSDGYSKCIKSSLTLVWIWRRRERLICAHNKWSPVQSSVECWVSSPHHCTISAWGWVWCSSMQHTWPSWRKWNSIFGMWRSEGKNGHR